jgi:hypothetical protein
LTIRRRSLRKALVIVGCLVGNLALPTATAGGVLILAGMALHFWSKGCLEQNRNLTTAGPYRFTRNPFYLANLLIDVGLCFVIGRMGVAWLYLPIWFISYRDTIKREEARLAELFPDDYEDYRAMVPAFLPTGKAWSAKRINGKFSLENEGLAKGAEYARILGILIAPIAICSAAIIRRLGTGILDGEHTLELVICVTVPALWVWKLALAETFRRPETRLFPWPIFAEHRSWILIGLFFVFAYLVTSQPWAGVLPVLWAGLVLLDALGEARSERLSLDRLKAWPYFPAIATLSTTSCGLLWVLLLTFP